MSNIRVQAVCASDLSLQRIIGTIFNDYSTVGWTGMPSGAGVPTADQHRVYLEGHDFGRIHLRDFLSGLAREV